MFKIYWQALDGFRTKSIIAVFLFGIGGFLEGAALTAIIPLLDIGLSGNQSSNTLAPWLERLGMTQGQAVYLILGAFIALGLISSLVKLLSEALFLRIRTGLEECLRVKMTRALFSMAWSPFLSMRLGDISKAMVLEGLQTAAGVYILLQGFGALLVTIAFLGIALFISVRMTLITLSFGVMGAAGYRLMGNRASYYAEKLSNITTSIGDQIAEIFGNLKFFRATGMAPQAEEKANSTYRNFAKTYYGSQIYGSIMRSLFEIGGIVFIGGFLGYALLFDRQAFAQSIVFLAVFYRLAPRIMVVNDSLYQARTYQPWYLTWKERYDLAYSFRDSAAGGKKANFERELLIQNITFSYPGSQRPAVNRVSLKINRGECIALVGESGSGKSTVVDILTGLLKPDSGNVSIDGVTLSELDLEEWRTHIGLVMQESPLFHGTILENIVWGDSIPDRENAKYSAELANAWDFIERLPQGLDTDIGEKGGRLSGGQRQRIALARALYREPWLLILDEATSALDGESEARIQEALESLKGNYSILIIAHRINTVKIADKIIVLGNGTILEEGTWQELIGKPQGLFQRMAGLQGLV